MKNVKILLIATICSVLANNIYAQARPQKETPLYKNNVSISTGFSAIGGLMRLAGNISPDTITSYSTPAIQFNYERKLVKWFTIGGSISYQRMGIAFSPLVYFDEFGTEVVANASFDFNLINIAAKGLFTYVNTKNICLYSGIRLGVTQWLIDVEGDISDPNFDYESETGVSPATVFAPQLILFGMNGYFTDHLGAGFELGIGSPHVISAGIAYRF